MWSAPGGKPIYFTAKQLISTNETETAWLAKAYFARSVLVVDYFDKSIGGLQVKLLGAVPPANMVGGDCIAKGEALRFLVELPFNTDAILLNTNLQWTAIDVQSFKVAAGLGSARGEIIFELGNDDLIKTASAASPPYGTKVGSITEYPWHGRFWDYQTVQGRSISMQAEVAWSLNSGDFVYWRGSWITGKPSLYRTSFESADQKN